MENKLIGRFAGTGILPVYDARVDGPTSQACPCTFDQGDFGPGDYRFTWSGAGVESLGQRPMLFAADVAPIPE